MFRAVLPRLGITLPILASTAVLVWAWLGANVTALPVQEGASLAEVREALSLGVDLREHLASARVRQGERKCTQWTGSRWNCGPSPWHFVGHYRGRATTDRGIEDRACIWAHPRTRGNTPIPVKITFPDIELGRFLYGEASILDSPKTGEAVDVVIHVDGRRRGRFRVTDNRGRRWVNWRVDTTQDAGKRGSVELRISARKESWRHLCFTAFVGIVDGGPG